MGACFDGDSNAVTIPTAGGPVTYRALARQDGPRGEKGKVYEVTVYCPDGSDPNIAPNTDTVYAGLQGPPVPPRPGLHQDVELGQPVGHGLPVRLGRARIVFVTFGGSKPRD